YGPRIIPLLTVDLPQLLIEEFQRFAVVFARARIALLLAHSADGVVQDLDRIVMAALSLVEHRLIVQDFEIAGCKLPGVLQRRAGIVVFSERGLDLPDAEIILILIRFSDRQLLVGRKRIRIFLLREKGFRQAFLMAGLIRISLYSLAIRLLGVRKILVLQIRAAEQIVYVGRCCIVGRTREKINRLVRFSPLQINLA